MRTVVSESEFEKIVDRRVQSRLASDSAYRFAEDAEAQSAAEERIELEVVREVEERFEVR